jgi:RNA polymerase sigma-70 factor (ECF subfamily)
VKDFDYQHWLKAASRQARRANEAADLLHDALLDAIRAGQIDFAREENRRWFSGVLRNRAAMTARSATRRRKRETTATASLVGHRSRAKLAAPSDAFIRSLPPSARSVATLVASGMSKRDILSALHLTDTGFRQRMTTIRRAWRKLPEADQQAAEEGKEMDSDLALGLMRRALLRHVRQLGGVGTHDPDGHLIVLAMPPPSRKST